MLGPTRYNAVGTIGMCSTSNFKDPIIIICNMSGAHSCCFFHSLIPHQIKAIRKKCGWKSHHPNMYNNNTRKLKREFQHQQWKKNKESKKRDNRTWSIQITEHRNKVFQHIFSFTNFLYFYFVWFCCRSCFIEILAGTKTRNRRMSDQASEMKRRRKGQKKDWKRI